MLYHVLVETKSERVPTVILDLTEEQLQRNFVVPYKQQRPLMTKGKVIQHDDIKFIHISRSDEISSEGIARMAEEEAQHRVPNPDYAFLYALNDATVNERFVLRCEDVTNEVLSDTAASEYQTPGQHIILQNTTVGQVNVAGRDISVVNRDVFGEKSDDIQSLLQEIRLTLESDASLTQEEREDASRDLTNLEHELRRPTPRSERIRPILDNFAKIATVGQFVTGLLQLLSSCGVM